MDNSLKHRVAVVGGAGHVGLPFGMLLCECGHFVTLLDRNAEAFSGLKSGKMPFQERGADELLPACLDSDRFVFSTDQHCLSEQDIVVVTIGTPVDEYLDPDIKTFDAVINSILSEMHDGQILMIRSTVFPGVTERLGRQVEQRNLKIDVCYCPERIAQGFALEELTKLPQIVSGCSEAATQRAAEFLEGVGMQVICVSTIEAELAKLFTNSYRYINFAISNQFYMLAEHYGADFHRIHQAVTHNYPRMNGFAKSGFAAGPCLLKDTMQLASFNHNLLTLGQHAMMVNEGLPRFVIDRLKVTRNLKNETVGILGMAFKGNCDDARSSLSYKIKKILSLECQRVLCTDPYVKDETLVPLEVVMQQSDVLILAACHEQYRNLSTEKPIVDVFRYHQKGEQ